MVQVHSESGMLRMPRYAYTAVLYVFFVVGCQPMFTLSKMSALHLWPTKLFLFPPLQLSLPTFHIVYTYIL